jgi:hypothetical protein
VLFPRSSKFGLLWLHEKLRFEGNIVAQNHSITISLLLRPRRRPQASLFFRDCAGVCRLFPSPTNASILTDIDVVKHVLFGSVPLPASNCGCFTDMTKWLQSGNLGIVKSVMKDLSCVSCAVYTEVSSPAPWQHIAG